MPDRQERFCELVEDPTIRATLRCVAARVVGHSDAEDVLQEALIKAWHSLDRLEDPARMLGWLCQITRNKGLDRVRSRRITVSVHDESTAEPSADEEEGCRVERSESAQTVLEYLDELSPTQQTVVLLRFGSDKTPSEIAKDLGITPNNARVTLHLAIRKLRENPDLRRRLGLPPVA